MEIKVKLTTKEIFLFSIYHFYRSWAGIMSIGVLIAAVVVTGIRWEGLDESVKDTLPIVIMLAAVMQVFILYRKAAKQAENPQMGQEIQYKLDYTGVRAHQGKNSSIVSWDQIVRVKRVFDMYVLYLAGRQGFLIPDRVLLLGNKRDRFLSVIKRYVAADRIKGIKLDHIGEKKNDD